MRFARSSETPTSNNFPLSFRRQSARWFFVTKSATCPSCMPRRKLSTVNQVMRKPLLGCTPDRTFRGRKFPCKRTSLEAEVVARLFVHFAGSMITICRPGNYGRVAPSIRTLTGGDSGLHTRLGPRMYCKLQFRSRFPPRPFRSQGRSPGRACR